MFNLIEQYHQKKAKSYGVKLNNIHRFTPYSQLQIEAPCRIGDVVADIPVTHVKKLNIGAYTYIRSNSELLCISEIGRFCSIGRNVILGLTPRNHPIDWVSTSGHVSRNYDEQCKPLKIGHDVWIAHNAVIMAGISIGHGAVIGCNAIVTKDVAPYQIVAGNPAKEIRFRFSNTQIQALLESEWWHYEIKDLRSINFTDVENFSHNLSIVNKKQKAMYKSILVKNKKVYGGITIPLF